MYTIYIDDTLIYSPVMQDRKLREAQANLELNAFGGLTFSIGIENTARDAVGILSGTVTLFDDNTPIFKGRVLGVEKSFDNVLEVICEGALGYLCDSVLDPFDYTGSVDEFVEMIINNHNSQVKADRQLIPGNITVTDPNDYIIRSSIEYLSTWEVCKTRLLDLLGGYLYIRYESDGIYVDYLEDFNTINPQMVEFSKNLLDFNDYINGTNIATAIIPLGARLEDENGSQTDERLTIESVNDGIKYVYSQQLVDLYGWIKKPVIHDGITAPGNLLTAGMNDLSEQGVLIETLEISAVDLSKIGLAIGSFYIGNYTKVISRPHNFDRSILTRKVSIDLLDPTGGKLVLGHTQATISGLGAEVKRENALIREQISSSESRTAINIQNTKTDLITSLTMLADSIRAEVGETITVELADGLESVLSQINTILTQTNEGWTFQFNKFWQDFTNLSISTTAQFSDISKYIRFIDGNIIIGVVGDPLSVIISNNRVSFMSNGAEVAFISESMLSITHARIIQSLDLYGFRFIPRSNGNLSLK